MLTSPNVQHNARLHRLNTTFGVDIKKSLTDCCQTKPSGRWYDLLTMHSYSQLTSPNSSNPPDFVSFSVFLTSFTGLQTYFLNRTQTLKSSKMKIVF